MDAFFITSVSNNDIIYERYYGRTFEYPTKEILQQTNPSSTYKLVNSEYIIVYHVENDIRLIGILKHAYFLDCIWELMHSICDSISIYFMEDITAQLLRDNIITVMLLLEEMVDFGLPGIINTDALKLIIPPKTALTKTMNFFKGYVSGDLFNYIGSSIPTGKITYEHGGGLGTGSGMGVGSGLLSTGSNNWWRSGNVRHLLQNSQLNITESLSCIIDENKTVVSSYLSGIIDFRSHITGVPKVQMLLSDLSVLGKPPMISFHPAVDQNLWQADNTIKFIPTDTYFEICEYSVIPITPVLPPLLIQGNFVNIDTNKSIFSKNLNYSSSPNKEIPKICANKTEINSSNEINFYLTIKPNTAYTNITNTSIESVSNIKITNIVVTLILPKNCESFSFTSVSQGMAKHIPEKHKMTWSLSSFEINSTKECSCRGTIKLNSKLAISSSNVGWIALLDFNINNWTMSNIRVTSLELLNSKSTFSSKDITYLTRAKSILFHL